MAHKNVGDFEIGDEVMISPENDNENYDSFRDKKLIIVDKVTSSDEHPAFDSALEGQGLYSFETEDGEEVPFSLYDYELVMPYSLYMEVNYDENYNIQKEEEKLRDLENITIQAENEVKKMSDSEVANYLGIPVSEINNLKRDDAVDKRVEELFNLWLEKDYENGGTTKNWDEYERGGKVVRYSDGRKRRLDTWNSGRSWTMDRKYYNKNEDWEIPMNERKTKGKQEVSFLTGEPIKEEEKKEEKVETSFLSGQPTEVKEEKKEEKVETSFLSGEPKEEEGEGITGLAERGGKIVRYSDGRKRRLDTWNSGRSWTMDRKYYNKNEDWEIPMDKRSSKSKTEKSFLSGEPTEVKKQDEVKKDDTNWSWLGFEDGGEMGGYMVFNYTDNIYASPEVFRTKREANDFIREFRKRFERQGYYRDNKMNKVAIEDIDLLAIPSNFSPFNNKSLGNVSKHEAGGGVRKYGNLWEWAEDDYVEKEYDKILWSQILAGDIDEDEVEELSISEKRKFVIDFYNNKKYESGGGISIERAVESRERDKKRNRLVIKIGDKKWHITQQEAKVLLNQLENLVEKYELGGGVDGRSTRDKSTWNSGASWTRDRNSFNKSEDWEIPMNKRKHEEGGNIQSEISKEELENMVGRKLNGWNDDKVEYNGNTYQKCFLKPYYKLI